MYALLKEQVDVWVATPSPTFLVELVKGRTGTRRRPPVWVPLTVTLTSSGYLSTGVPVLVPSNTPPAADPPGSLRHRTRLHVSGSSSSTWSLATLATSLPRRRRSPPTRTAPAVVLLRDVPTRTKGSSRRSPLSWFGPGTRPRIDLRLKNGLLDYGS